MIFFLLIFLFPVLGVIICGFCIRYLWRTSKSKRGEIKRPVVRICVSIGAAICALSVAWFLSIHVFWFNWAYQAKKLTDQKQIQLLYQSDHEALRDAGRKILSDANTYTNEFMMKDELPETIRNLSPSHASILPGRQELWIEMGGGFFHFGFTIFPEGIEGNGLKKLIPGLWYYSEDNKIIQNK